MEKIATTKHKKVTSCKRMKICAVHDMHFHFHLETESRCFDWGNPSSQSVAVTCIKCVDRRELQRHWKMVIYSNTLYIKILCLHICKFNRFTKTWLLSNENILHVFLQKNCFPVDYLNRLLLSPPSDWLISKNCKRLY